MQQLDMVLVVAVEVLMVLVVAIPLVAQAPQGSYMY